MKSLSKTEQEKVDTLVDKAYELHEAGQSKQSFEHLEKAYLVFPNPLEYPEAYNISKYIFEDYIKLNDLQSAKIWLNKMIENNNQLHHSDDDCLFAIAKFQFKNNNHGEALKLFKQVVNEAGMRYFEGEAPEYKDFYLHPEKYNQ